MPLNPKYVEYLNYDWDSAYDMGVDKMRATYQQMMQAGKEEKKKLVV